MFWLFLELISTPLLAAQAKMPFVIVSCTCSFLDVIFFCFLTVIGGYKIYLRLTVIGECDKKGSIWETLKNQVPYVHWSLTQRAITLTKEFLTELF